MIEGVEISVAVKKLQAGDIVVVHVGGKVGDETAIARIAHLVENAANNQALFKILLINIAKKLFPLSFLLSAFAFLFTRDLFWV